jgi:hypothetical protein
MGVFLVVQNNLLQDNRSQRILLFFVWWRGYAPLRTGHSPVTTQTLLVPSESAAPVGSSVIL